PLVGGVVDRGEDAVGASRSVLIRGLKRNRGGKRVSDTQRWRIIDRGDVDAREEARRVRRGARPAERARGQAYLPASLGERPGERARDLRRTAAGKKEQCRTDTTSNRPRRPVRLRPVIAPAAISHPALIRTGSGRFLPKARSGRHNPSGARCLLRKPVMRMTKSRERGAGADSER